MSGSPRTISADLPREPASASSARRLVRRALRELAPDAPSEVVELAVLLTSEVTSNAIRHARTPFTVTVTRHDPMVRIAVRDGSRALPSRRRHNLAAPTGRGVAMLQDCAARCGVERHPDGKTVWFELEAEPAAALVRVHAP